VNKRQERETDRERTRDGGGVVWGEGEDLVASMDLLRDSRFLYPCIPLLQFRAGLLYNNNTL